MVGNMGAKVVIIFEICKKKVQKFAYMRNLL